MNIPDCLVFAMLAPTIERWRSRGEIDAISRLELQGIGWSPEQVARGFAIADARRRRGAKPKATRKRGAE